jgi:hypothetical protein
MKWGVVVISSIPLASAKKIIMPHYMIGGDDMQMGMKNSQWFMPCLSFYGEYRYYLSMIYPIKKDNPYAN